MTPSQSANVANTLAANSPLVLFDGACPMCRREIAHYRRVHGATRLAWLDIARDHAALPIDGIGRETAMARFHVRDSRGIWHTGAYGFAELWSHLRGYRHVSRAIRALHLLPLIDRAYTHFARWRLRRQCNEDTCSPRHDSAPNRSAEKSPGRGTAGIPR